MADTTTERLPESGFAGKWQQREKGTERVDDRLAFSGWWST
uniref:Uncharacterized protein n=1 Tax=viral metagenome TaxID=1070528 RepID=A0A6M3LKT6_9ZZZZ